jgi:hypothetical protein
VVRPHPRRAREAAGAAGRAAGTETAKGAKAALTGWQAVTAALAEYATKAREIGGEIGSALVGAFQSAETAIGDFVKTGKLDMRDLVTSMIADLAKLAARRFILGPIANALSGALGGAGGMLASVLHAGGTVGAPGPGRMVPALAFAHAPRMHNGGWAGLRPDEVPAILQRGERVLSRQEVAQGLMQRPDDPAAPRALGLRPDEVPAILRRGERVLSRQDVAQGLMQRSDGEAPAEHKPLLVPERRGVTAPVLEPAGLADLVGSITAMLGTLLARGKAEDMTPNRPLQGLSRAVPGIGAALARAFPAGEQPTTIVKAMLGRPARNDETARAEVSRPGKGAEPPLWTQASSALLGPVARVLAEVIAGLDPRGSVLAPLTASVFHAGGLVGAGGAMRAVPALAFAQAPRLHSGGWAGLRPDEVPAILQRGERVLSRREVSAGLAGTGPQHLEISVQVEGARGNREIEEMVQAGVSSALQHYDRLVAPRTLARVSQDPRRRG